MEDVMSFLASRRRSAALAESKCWQHVQMILVEMVGVEA